MQLAKRDAMMIDSNEAAKNEGAHRRGHLNEADASLLCHLTKRLNACSHIMEVLEEALSGLVAIAGASRVAILAFDAARAGSTCVVAKGLGATEESLLANEVTPDLCRRIISDGGGETVDVEDDALLDKLAAIFDTPGLLSIPVATADSVRGLILIAGDGKATDQGRREMDLMATVANSVAAAVARCEFMAEMERQVASLSMLQSVTCDVTQVVTSSLNLRDVLDRVAEATASILGADASAVWLLDSSTKTLGVEAICRLSKEFGRRDRLALGVKPAGFVAEGQLTLSIADIASDEDANLRDLASREGVTSYAGVPLMLRGQCIGVIEAFARGGPRQFSEEDMQRLVALGHQAAVAIENARLFQAERDTVTKLRQLERHKTDFMAMLAHELRTPLTSIKGFAQLVLRQNACAKPEVVERYSRIIETESNRMIGIINDILDISKMEAGLLEMSRQPLSMPDLIHQAVAAAEPLSRDHVLELHVPETLPLIRGDAAKIEQVLTNLIGNAVRYSPAGEPVEIGATADDEGVTVWVNDRGRGIPVDKFNHIFNKYGMVEDGNGESRSGLGLYISKNFVEAHGGQMWVESEEGKGAKFLFKLYY
ncbi:MAG: GAF domain-containing protein [Chloroflexi bacterium]|nr:GAF domain-containing protein [Chloroflexota bacterium]